MFQSEKPLFRGWLKNVLRFIALLLSLFLVLTAMGVFAAEYLKNIDIRAWFIKTQWLWFGVRLLLYSVIIFMIFVIAQRHPLSMPKKAKWLILMVLIFAEAITQISFV
jgi:hypothetical protein